MATRNKQDKPITVLIAAMGGEGGGVLTSWLVEAARKAGLPVQATSVPGVAQRTGATTYYIEIVPVPYDKLGGKEPVMDLYPGPGDVDLMVATELVETGRALEKGFISPDRTTLVASTHRVYTLAEKMAMGDNRYDGDKILEAARQMAKNAVLFNMEKAATDAGTIINAVILGAIAGSEVLPISAEAFEDGIKASGKAVESNLRGFQMGLSYAKGDVVEVRPKQAEPKAPSAGPEKSTDAFKSRIERDYPAETHPVVMEACGRVLDYHDAKYARLYLDRLDGIRKIDDARGNNDFKLTNEVARHLGLRMTFEDIMRVAQLKTRASRHERVRREVQAAPDQLVQVTEFLKPGIEEFASVMPPFIAKPMLRWAEKNPERKRKTHFGMRIRSDKFTGFMRVRMVAGMRPFRRIGYRYKEEQKQIQRWLGLVTEAAAIDRDLALEVTELARLIKGYGSTHARGNANFDKIVAEVLRPALDAKRADAAADIRKVREAALADPEGATLANAIASLSATGPALAEVEPTLAAQ